MGLKKEKKNQYNNNLEELQVQQLGIRFSPQHLGPQSTWRRKTNYLILTL